MSNDDKFACAESRLANAPYLGGNKPNEDDAKALECLGGNPPDQVKFPLFYNWLTVVCNFQPSVVNTWKAVKSTYKVRNIPMS